MVNFEMANSIEVPRKYALYARVSTSRHKCRCCRRQFAVVGDCPNCGSSDIERGQDPETQLLPLRQYAESKNAGWIEYVDTGISGAKTSRPSLNQLMYDARHRVFQTVVVARFDRFARSVRHLLNALEEFRDLDVAFVSLSENIDTSSIFGRMIFTVLAAVAQFERDLILERTQAGIARARDQHRTFGRPKKIFDRQALRNHYKQTRSIRETAKHFKVSRTLAWKTIVTP